MMPVDRNNSNKARRPYQRKKVLKGHKSLRGVPELYETVKQRIYIRLTESSSDGLTLLAEQYSLSRSELLEQIGRQIITIRVSTQSLEQSNPLEAGTQMPRCFALTAKGIYGLDDLASQAGITRKVLIEQLGLGNIQIISRQTSTVINPKL
jgi:hypothetical protein